MTTVSESKQELETVEEQLAAERRRIADEIIRLEEEHQRFLEAVKSAAKKSASRDNQFKLDMGANAQRLRLTFDADRDYGAACRELMPNVKFESLKRYRVFYELLEPVVTTLDSVPTEYLLENITENACRSLAVSDVPRETAHEALINFANQKITKKALPKIRQQYNDEPTEVEGFDPEADENLLNNLIDHVKSDFLAVERKIYPDATGPGRMKPDQAIEFLKSIMPKCKASRSCMTEKTGDGFYELELVNEQYDAKEKGKPSRSNHKYAVPFRVTVSIEVDCG